MDGYIDNNIEFYKDGTQATVTFSQGRFINAVRRLKEEHPDKVEIVTDDDGVLCAHIPVEWVKIRPSRTLSESQRKSCLKNLEAMRARKSTQDT